MLWKTFESHLSPTQVKERISHLPDLPGRIDVKENTVCGVPTKHGGELWMLMPGIHYRGGGPVPLIVRVEERPGGCRVRCCFSNWKENLKASLFLFCALVLAVINDGMQGKITWQAVFLGLSIGAVELFAIISLLNWVMGKIEKALSHSTRQRDELLLAWVEKELLGECTPAVDAAAILRAEIRYKHCYLYRCPYPAERLREKLEEWVGTENQRRSEQLVSRIKWGKRVQEPRKDRVELIWKGRRFILRSNRTSSQFSGHIEENGAGEPVMKGHFSLSPGVKAYLIAFGALFTLGAWRVPWVMLILIGIYVSFVGGDFLHAERMDSSMEIVLFLREHLEEETSNHIP